MGIFDWLKPKPLPDVPFPSVTEFRVSADEVGSLPSEMPTKTVGQKQELFSRLVPKLLDFAHQCGYQVRIGEVYRTKEQAEWYATHCAVCREFKTQVHRGHTFRPIGIKNSIHTKKLAIDLALFFDGEYLQDAEDYRKVGEYWKTLHELCCWGGDFRNRDAGHFSITHGGVK